MSHPDDESPFLLHGDGSETTIPVVHPSPAEPGNYGCEQRTEVRNMNVEIPVASESYQKKQEKPFQ